MKPIEPGCLAILLGENPRFNGRVVRPMRLVPADPISKAHGISRVWECEADWPIPADTTPTSPEVYLLRIDGHEETEEEQEAINTIQEAIGAT